MSNLSNRTQSFFSDVVTGQGAAHKPSHKYETFSDFKEGDIRHLKATARVFDSMAGEFDEHIACSIPTFRECQLTKAWAIATAIPNGGSMLDIGGSEGTMLKTVATAAPDANFFNLDPNMDMLSAFNRNKPTNALPIPLAFLEGFEGVEAYDPFLPAYDVINETMTFQFIKKDRVVFVDEVKRLLKSDGIFFTEEKFQHPSKAEYLGNENKKDRLHKIKYFTPEQLAAKTEQVLVGMSELQADVLEYRQLLESKFKFVSAYWVSGNFKGFMCSDSEDTFKLYQSLMGRHLTLHKFGY